MKIPLNAIVEINPDSGNAKKAEYRISFLITICIGQIRLKYVKQSCFDTHEIRNYF
jgi:hypothetical protein